MTESSNAASGGFLIGGIICIFAAVVGVEFLDYYLFDFSSANKLLATLDLLKSSKGVMREMRQSFMHRSRFY